MRALVPVVVCIVIATALACAPAPRSTVEITQTPAAVPRSSSSPPTRTIVSGPLTFEVSISMTAQTFYVIDELALGQASHPQYERWAAREGFLTDRGRALLEQHMAMRQRVGANTLERVFGTTLEPDAAMDRAASEAALSRDDLDVEARAFGTFGPFAKTLFARRAAALEAFREKLAVELPKLAATFDSLVTFAEAVQVGPIRVFLIGDPNDHGSGGGSNGNVWWVEVTDGSGSMGTLLFNAFGALLRHRDPEINTAATACGNGLDRAILGQAIIEAFAPGTTSISLTGEDELAGNVANARKWKTPVTDWHLRVSRFGLALRPILESSLARKKTFASFMANVCSMWTALQAEPWP